MAMNGPQLGDEIVQFIMSPEAPARMQAQIYELWEKIGTVIVKHIQDNAVVTVESGIAVDNTGTQQQPAWATVEEGTGTVQ